MDFQGEVLIHVADWRGFFLYLSACFMCDGVWNDDLFVLMCSVFTQFSLDIKS